MRAYNVRGPSPAHDLEVVTPEVDAAGGNVLSLRRALHLVWRNRWVAAAVIVMTGLVSMAMFRSLEKSYRSYAVISFDSLHLSNPAKETGGQDITARELTPAEVELRELRAELLSHDVLAEAAKNTGLLERYMRRGSFAKTLSRMLWDLGGGEISADPQAIERQIIDKLRWEKTTLSGSGGVYTVSVSDSDPAMAQRFLGRLLEILATKLKDERHAREEKVAAFYDDQIKDLAGRVAGNDGNVDPKVVRLQLQRVGRLREELQSKLLEENSLKISIESSLAPKRQALAEARAKYAESHPAVAELKRATSEEEVRLNAPLARVRGEIASLKAQLDKDFESLAENSEQTFDGAGASQESHSQYFTKDRADRRSLNRVYERVQERYFQALVQKQIDMLAEASLVRILEEPSLPARPEAPKLGPAVLGSIVAAFMLALLAVAMRELMRRKVGDPWLAAARVNQSLIGQQRAPAATLLPARPGKGRLEGMAATLAAATADTAQVSEPQDLTFETGRLLTYLGSFRDLESGTFRCAFLPASDRTAGGIVALNAAILCAREAPGRTVLVSFGHPLSVFGLLKNGQGSELQPAPDWPALQAYRLVEHDLVVVDASGEDFAMIVDLVTREPRARNVVFDLPGPSGLAWSCFWLPWMPVVCVAESGKDKLSELRRQVSWLKLFADGRGAPVGLYVTGCREPQWVRHGGALSG